VNAWLELRISPLLEVEVELASCLVFRKYLVRIQSKDQLYILLHSSSLFRQYLETDHDSFVPRTSQIAVHYHSNRH
jgi:hypothetical protein